MLVPVPKMTAEGRQSVVKTASALSEQTKQSIRESRRGALKALKHYAAAVALSKDEVHTLEAALQQSVKGAVGRVDGMLKTKTEALSR